MTARRTADTLGNTWCDRGAYIAWKIGVIISEQISAISCVSLFRCPEEEVEVGEGRGVKRGEERGKGRWEVKEEGREGEGVEEEGGVRELEAGEAEEEVGERGKSEVVGEEEGGVDHLLFLYTELGWRVR